MKQIRLGVFGARRGVRMMAYCRVSDQIKTVAVCDQWSPALEEVRREFPGEDIALYEDFDTFLTHDMDAVILAVSHDAFKDFTPENMASFFRGDKVLLDVKGLLDKNAFEAAGYRYWRL